MYLRQIFLSPIVLIAVLSCNNLCDPNLEYDGKITTLNGERYTGDCVTFFDDGKTIRSEKEYLNGLDHGIWTFYHPDGVIQTTGEFDKGKRIGTWKYNFRNGNLWKSQDYDNQGNPTGLWITYTEEGDTLNYSRYSWD